MAKILLINKGKSRWSARLEIFKREDEYGGLDISITDKFGDEAEKHIITLEAHHGDAKRLILKLIDVLLT